MSKLIVIIGPTASGKTNLAVRLARKFNGGLISADSCQIYKGMDIGTAKPTVPHYLIDIKNPNQNYSVAEYRKDALDAVTKVIASGKTPILVGGTGLYISAVANNWQIPQIKENKKLRAEIEQKIKKHGLKKVFGQLVALDPEAAYIVDPKNPRRIIRALEVTILTGAPFSEQRKKGKPLYKILTIGLNPSPEILKKRIAVRNKKMVRDGLVNEVKKLVSKYGYKCRALDAIGYREIINYLKKKSTLEQALIQMQNNTWHYAKRQLTWFKKYNKDAHWIKNQSEAEKLVRKFLKK